MAQLTTAEAFPEEVTTLQVSWGLQMAAVNNSLTSSHRHGRRRGQDISD